MYYILNETKQIIAADDSLLTLCGVAHIDELYAHIAKGAIVLDLLSDEHIKIQTEEEEYSFDIEEISLSSLLGHLTLINIFVKEETSIESPVIKEENISESLLSKDVSVVPEDILLPHEITEDEEKTTLLLVEDTPKNISLDNKVTEDDNLILLKDILEITIDIEKNSQIIGISSEDYTNFFNEFIDTALDLEKDLQSENSDIRANAVNTLSHLSDILHVPTIGAIIAKIENAKDDEQTKLVESFYTTLSQLTTSKERKKTFVDIVENETVEPAESKEEEIHEKEEASLELFDEPIPVNEPTVREEIQTRKTSNNESFGAISLEGIQPKHFDFQLEEAANNLSLPIELIEEFIHDFIKQAHIETKKILQAYENGDLDTIQKIGHLLKGTSSNLHINALSDTLYKIQFCEDPKNLENLIKDYWAHFLYFENKINIISD